MAEAKEAERVGLTELGLEDYWTQEPTEENGQANLPSWFTYGFRVHNKAPTDHDEGGAPKKKREESGCIHTWQARALGNFSNMQKPCTETQDPGFRT